VLADVAIAPKPEVSTAALGTAESAGASWMGKWRGGRRDLLDLLHWGSDAIASSISLERESCAATPLLAGAALGRPPVLSG
jgi:hypothetical protein